MNFHLPKSDFNLYPFIDIFIIKRYYLYITITFTFLFSVTEVPGQDINYGKYLIDTLCSPSMHGRGYVNKGDSIAAAFIANEFQKQSLKHFGENYYQYFKFSVNTFPGKMYLSINNRSFVPGQDFLVEGISKSIKGSFKTILFSKSVLTDSLKKKIFIKHDFSNKLVVIDSSGIKRAEMLSFFESNHISPNLYMYLTPRIGSWRPRSYLADTVAFGFVKKNFPDTATIVDLDIEHLYIENYLSQNVIGYIEGSVYKDSFIILSAHYDHLGRMGAATYFPGANDNASGTSMVLSLAKHYTNPTNRPEYSIIFIAFAAEELGILGSAYFVNNSPIPLKKIKLVINLDLMGAGEDGMMVVNGKVFTKKFEQLTAINNEKEYLIKIKRRGKAKNSDHYYFSNNGVPAFFFYTLGGSGYYHDIYDTPGSLQLTEFIDIQRLIIDFIELQ